LFKEIEFYFYNKNHRDIITHPRESKPLCWYINDFGGIDLNFGSKIRYEKRLNSNGKKVEKCVLDDSAYFGGILIRQLISEDGCEILSGPLACAELFRCHNATGVDKEFPVLVDNNAIVKYIRKPRVNLLRSKQSVEDKVNNILYQYHDNIQSFKETLYQDFINFKDKPYGYEQQIASR
ncbi:MAG: peptidyl-arginine deiminase, partial [Prevotella sp.]|nr:peptidyl-arginine deiminase [Prevotella sp.]